MGLPELFNWRSQTAAQTTASMPAVADDDLAAEVDEPPDHGLQYHINDFNKSAIRPTQTDRKISLLSRALHTEAHKPDIHITTDLSRRRSMRSDGSLASASTAELTSDGGLTSPARTNTPSPPFPSTTYTSFTPYSLASKSVRPVPVSGTTVEMKDSVSQPQERINVSPKSQPPVEVVPKKRCITFACGKKSPVVKPPPMVTREAATTISTVVAPKRPCAIKFACGNPKSSEKLSKLGTPTTPQSLKGTESPRRNTSRSPSMTRKSPRPAPPLPSTTRSHRDSSSTVRRASQSPLAIRSKPKYIIADEAALQSSEATRFHEFASGEIEEDDWIRKETDNLREKMTINDTLKKENAIRQLGNEAEEEALEEDEDEDEEDDQDGNDSDDENGFENDEDNSVDGSDEEASDDGNETDNEAGFAESDDETDGEGDFAFWTPGQNIHHRQTRGVTHYRASAHRATSASSLESSSRGQSRATRRKPRRPPPIKIRPGTPDLPDSTDFVCGTLDEDRPIEDAYVSCMEARKMAKHKRCPQDIDPSFPTSDPEDEEDEHDILPPANDSDDHIWLHGKFEDSDHEHHGRWRRSNAPHRRSPRQSPKRLRSPPPPKRLHSPPPARTRLRSPPPRKLFGQSPNRLHSPPPARNVRSPPASPTNYVTSTAITFEPLGSRPGLTHTKSLPRTPNAFCRQYRMERLASANGIGAEDSNEGPVRGAIDIVKGLEQKRQRRKEKFYQKHCNRKNKVERKPQPGKGAERMEQLGLLLSGKTGARGPYVMSM